MIGSSVFDAESSNMVKKIRSSRMSDSDNKRSDELVNEVSESESVDRKNKIFEQLASCLFESDTFDPDTRDLEIIECQYSVNKSVWADFKRLRDTPGKLTEIHSKIKCPVINIHGDHDPHIIEGIQPFLESCLEDLKLHWLENCGHYPWIERQAKGQFYSILFNELNKSKVVTFVPHTEEQIQKHNTGEAKPINTRIQLIEYDSNWPEEYHAIEAKIRSALATLSIEIHHVGSTSVPGLAAKPIIDLVLELPDSTIESDYVPQLESAGFWLKIREADWFEHRMFKSHFAQVNLHVFTNGCSEVEKMIAFRNHLRSNKVDFDLYLAKKRELAEKIWKYTQNYADAKSAVVKDIFTRVQL